MKRTLLVEREIEAGDENCGICRYCWINGEGCDMFRVHCVGRRLPACLEAERRAKGEER
jgi:hypothetical protein